MRSDSVGDTYCQVIVDSGGHIGDCGGVTFCLVIVMELLIVR